jgi:hypothetical protein
MANSWTKNPRILDTLRSRANAFLNGAKVPLTDTARRHANNLATQLTKDMLSFWAPLLPPSAPSKSRREESR